jgi:hypothetical protein
MVKASEYTKFNRIGGMFQEDATADSNSSYTWGLENKAVKYRYMNESNGIQWVWATEKLLKGETIDNITYTGEGRRYDDPAYVRLSIFGIARSLPPKNGHFHINLFTGVPAKEARTDMNSKELRPMEKLLKDVLENNGQPHIVEIEEEVNGVWKKYYKTFTIRVGKIISQSMGSLANKAMLSNGKIDHSLMNDSNLILDVGGGTSIITCLNNQNIVEHDSVLKGMKVAYQEIKEKLDHKYPELEATVESIEQQIQDKKYYVSNALQVPEEEWSQIKEEVFNAHAQSILNSFKIKPEKYNNLFFVGGGSEGLYKFIKQNPSWTRIEKVDGSQTSNLQGYYKLLTTYIPQ